MNIHHEAIHAAGTPPFTHVWFWRPRMGEPDRKGKRCRIVARGARNSIAVQLEDGELVITSRWAVRKKSTPPIDPLGMSYAQYKRIKAIRAAQGWDEEDVLYLGWERCAIPEVHSLAELTESHGYKLIAALEEAVKEEATEI